MLFKTRLYDHNREELIYWMANNIGPLNRTSGISIFYGEDWEVSTGTLFLKMDNGNPPKKVYQRFFDVTINDPKKATFFQLKWS